MITATLASDPLVSVPTPHRRGELALILQEAFTAAVRLRSNRQVVADADTFRAHIKHLLGAADHEARRAGYDGEYVKLAVYAFIAFLDESVLNSRQPLFASWARQPLQEEIFGDALAGETFFVQLQDLLSRQDSEALADLLEVYLLCMLLGFRGRYGAADPGAMQGFSSAVQEKIRRIRGGYGPLSPLSALPADEVIPVASDPWIPRLGIFAAASALLAGVLFLVFRFSLASATAELQALTNSLLP